MLLALLSSLPNSAPIVSPPCPLLPPFSSPTLHRSRPARELRLARRLVHLDPGRRARAERLHQGQGHQAGLVQADAAGAVGGAVRRDPRRCALRMRARARPAALLFWLSRALPSPTPRGGASRSRNWRRRPAHIPQPTTLHLSRHAKTNTKRPAPPPPGPTGCDSLTAFCGGRPFCGFAASVKSDSNRDCKLSMNVPLSECWPLRRATYRLLCCSSVGRLLLSLCAALAPPNWLSPRTLPTPSCLRETTLTHGPPPTHTQHQRSQKKQRAKQPTERKRTKTECADGFGRVDAGYDGSCKKCTGTKFQDGTPSIPLPTCSPCQGGQVSTPDGTGCQAP